jgi:hypothetical protein
MWDEVDVLLTANPSLLLNKPNGKTVVKYKTIYNQDIKSEYEIETLKEFDEILKNILVC